MKARKNSKQIIYNIFGYENNIYINVAKIAIKSLLHLLNNTND